MKVSSRLTLVDVTVTDAHGHPVHGLTQADFTITEDGKPQTLKDFEEYGVEKSDRANASALPADVSSDHPVTPSAARPVNLLLFDQVATGISRGLQPNPETLKYAKDASEQFFRTMPAGTQIEVLEMDGEGLHIVQDVTSDPNLLIAAVNSIPYRRVPQAYWSPPPLGLTDPVLCAAMNFQSSQALNALNQTAAFISSLAGRKNLIWFTPGTSWLSDYQFFRQIPLIKSCLEDDARELQETYGRLASARVAVYAIDPRGLYNNPGQGASQSGPGGGSGVGFGFNIDSYLESGALEDVAKATGGKAYFSRNDLYGAVQASIADGADYYALSYVPPLSKYDEKYHTIRVKLDHPGLQLHYRQGYTSLDPAKNPRPSVQNGVTSAAQLSPLEAAMAHGLPPATELNFRLQVLPSKETANPGGAPLPGKLNPALQGKPLVNYRFIFTLPPDQITLVEQPDGTRKASFQLIVDAYGADGKLLNSNAQRGSFTLKAESPMQALVKPVAVPLRLDVPIGELFIRAGLRDLPSGKIGVFEIPFTVAAP